MTTSQQDGFPVEYGIDPRRTPEPIDETERRRMYDEYGRVRTYFKLRPDRYPQLQLWLTQARIPRTYDQYLAKTVWYAVALAFVGAALGLLVTWLLAASGVLAGVTTGVRGPIALFVSEHRFIVASLVLAPIVGAAFGAVTWYGRYYYPARLVGARRQSIDVVLPHAIVYMYALSYGGMSLAEVMEALADAEDSYGEVSREFAYIVSDLQLFGSDLYTALRNARNLTPSDHMEQFIDDMISVLEAGGDITTFLGEESETYLREAEDEQAEFLETLAVMAEIFVVAFVAAPLFLIVTLVVISLIGGDTIRPITALVYLAMPAATVGFLYLLDVLNKPYEHGSVSTSNGTFDRPIETGDDDDRFDAYAANRKRVALVRFLRDPLANVRARPWLSLVASVPAGLLVAVGLVAAGIVEPTLAAMRTEPVPTTTGLFVAPLLVALTPLSVAHELRRRRDAEIARRFPNTLNILSSANRMGIPLTDSLALVSRWSTGPLAEELRTVRNDLEWNHDARAALLGFGARLRVPQLSRTMKLLADGLRASGDLSRVLSIAAEDTRNRDRLDRARSRELSSYIAVVVIGFLVYLFVILMLDASFLAPISNVPQPEAGAISAPVSFVDVPVETYQMVFLHSALIMGAGTGLLAGKLAANDTLSGLKYSIILVAITLATFTLI